MKFYQQFALQIFLNEKLYIKYKVNINSLLSNSTGLHKSIHSMKQQYSPISPQYQYTKDYFGLLLFSHKKKQKYFNQFLQYGQEYQQKLMQSKIYIHGWLNKSGIELVKSLMNVGFKEIVLSDDKLQNIKNQISENKDDKINNQEKIKKLSQIVKYLQYLLQSLNEGQVQNNLVKEDRKQQQKQKQSNFEISQQQNILTSKSCQIIQQIIFSLQSINPDTKLYIAKSQQNNPQYIINAFDCIVILDTATSIINSACNASNNKLKQLSKLYRSNSTYQQRTKIIYGGSYGLFGFIFNDFGSTHQYLSKLEYNSKSQIQGQRYWINQIVVKKIEINNNKIPEQKQKQQNQNKYKYEIQIISLRKNMIRQNQQLLVKFTQIKGDFSWLNNKQFSCYIKEGQNYQTKIILTISESQFQKYSFSFYQKYTNMLQETKNQIKNTTEEINNQGKQDKINEKQINQIYDRICKKFYSFHKNGGTFKLRAKEKLIEFDSYQESLLKDYSNIKTQILNQYDVILSQNQGKCIFNTFLKFVQKFNNLPKLLNKFDSQQFLSLNQGILSGFIENPFIKKQMLAKISLFTQLEQDFCVKFISNLICSEVIKSKGKYQPINGWKFFNFTGIINQQSSYFSNQKNYMAKYLSSSQIKYNKRDQMKLVLGEQFYKKSQKLKIMHVGCKNAGEEMIKSYINLGIKQVCAYGYEKRQKDKNFDLYSQQNQYKALQAKTSLQLVQQKINNCIIKHKEENSITEFSYKFYPIRLSSQQNQIFYQSSTTTENSNHPFASQPYLSNLNLIVSTSSTTSTNNYISTKCSQYQIPFLTLSSYSLSSNILTFIPHQTGIFSDYQHQLKEFQYPMSGGFPIYLKDTINKANRQFYSLFQMGSSIMIEFVKNRSFKEVKEYIFKFVHDVTHRRSLSQILSQVKILAKMYEIMISNAYINCLNQAMNAFDQIFSKNIKIILRQFPEDRIKRTFSRKPPHQIQQSEIYFWDYPYTKPTQQWFDINNQEHCQFIDYSAKLYGKILGITVTVDYKKNEKQFKQVIISKVLQKRYQKQRIQMYKMDGSMEKKPNNIPMNNRRVQTQQQQRQEISKYYELILTLAQSIQSQNFTHSYSAKQINTSGKSSSDIQIEWIAVFCSIYAKVYGVQYNKKTDWYRMKQIFSRQSPKFDYVQKICASLGQYQLIKFIKNCKPKQNIRKSIDLILKNKSQPYILSSQIWNYMITQNLQNISLNLSSSSFKFNPLTKPTYSIDNPFDPIYASAVKVCPKQFSSWQKLIMIGPYTVKQLKELIQNQVAKNPGAQVELFYASNTMLYSSFMKKIKDPVMVFSIQSAYEQAKGKQLKRDLQYFVLEVSASNNGVEQFQWLLPSIKYYFK